jgi:hypothetical protein
MSEEKSSFSKDIEELVNKSVQANKIFMAEGTRLVKQLSNKAANKEPINLFQPELITDAFNAYTKLNIQHLKNMIDLGISLAKQAGNPTSQDNSNTKATEPSPAFILNGTADAGTKISLQFLLDNVKEQAVTCTMVNTDYILQSDFSVRQDFKTGFTPQSFVLQPAASQTVIIDISIPANTLPGLYYSNVQVKGFEPTFFSIDLTVNEKQSKKTNGSKGKRV